MQQDELQTLQTWIRCCVWHYLFWVYFSCSGLSVLIFKVWVHKVIENHATLYVSTGQYSDHAHYIGLLVGKIFWFLARLDKVQEELLHFHWRRRPHNVSFFKTSYFPNHMIDLVYICYDGRYRSKVLFSDTHNQGQSHRLSIFMLKLRLKFLATHIFQIILWIWFIWHDYRYRS